MCEVSKKLEKAIMRSVGFISGVIFSKEGKGSFKDWKIKRYFSYRVQKECYDAITSGEQLGISIDGFETFLRDEH